MSLMFHNGKLLFVNGMLAMSRDCCCDKCLSEPVTCVLEFQYSVGGTGRTRSLSSAANEQEVESHGASTNYSISFTRNGVMQTLQRTAGAASKTRVLDGDACGDETVPYLSYYATMVGLSIGLELHFHITQPGVISVMFLPGAIPYVDRYTSGPHTGEFVPGGAHRLDWTDSVAITETCDGTEVGGWTYEPTFTFGAPSSYSPAWTKSFVYR